MFQQDNFRKKIEHFGVLVLLGVAIVYGMFRTYPLITGPQVHIYSPHDGDIVSNSTFEISGKVSRVKEITLQGRPIPIGTDGHFTEIILATRPYTIVVITATDFFGKTTVKTMRVVPK